MNPKVILVFLLLAMLTSEAFSWWRGRRRRGRRRRRRSSSVQSSDPSPAGGPSSNSNAVVCNFYRSSDSITCTQGRDSATCDTVESSQTSDSSFGGPTPLGEYLIGKRRINPTHYIDWYNLYPKKEDNSGYYGYHHYTAKGRNRMGLHPGTSTLGCVTVVENCWQSLRRVVDSGNMYYRGSNGYLSSYSGYLFVK